VDVWFIIKGQRDLKFSNSHCGKRALLELDAMIGVDSVDG